jgi:hypothetical protein
MSRTALTSGASGLIPAAYDAGVQAPASPQAADATNGNSLAFTVGTSYGAFQVLLVVANGDSSSHNVIIRGSGYTGAANGSANSGIPAAQNTVFTQSTLGDLTVAVANGKTEVIGPFTTDRFAQPDGSLWIDWSAGTDMTIYAIQLPVTVS